MTVNCMLTDDKGLIWIGTASGLNCFDRHDMKRYFYEKENPYSLPGNTIHFIAEDSLQNIWISTNNGLARYEKTTDSFRPVLLNEEILAVNAYAHIRGGLLFSTLGGVFRFDYSEQTIRKIELKKEGIPFNPYYILPWEGEEVLLVATNKGILKYNYATEEATPTAYPVHTELNAAYVDNEKRLYLSSYKNGIDCYAPDGKKQFHISTANSRLSNDVVLDIIERDQKLWIATDGGGINIIDKNNPSDISIIIHTPGDNSSIPVNSIKCLYKDKQENIWAGTVRGGMIGIKEVFMKTYKDVPLNSSDGLSEESVISLYEDKTGLLWIGTDGGGINRYNPSTDTFKHYPSTYGDKVVSITGYSDSELLVSLYTTGVFRFNKATGQYTPFYIIDKETTADQLYGGHVLLAYQVTDEWSYFIGRNILSYNSKKRQFSYLKTDGKPMPSGRANMVAADSTSAFIIRSNKLYEVRHKSDTLHTLLSIGEHETINAVARDKNGIFWIGTEYGFGYFDSATKEFTKIETKLFNSVSTLLLDDKDRLWIGARSRLFSYDLKKNRFATWGESDGYTTNEFIYKYQISSVSDYIYLGGAAGLLRINKNISMKEETLPDIRLMELLLDGNPYTGEIDREYPAIVIPHAHRSLEIKVISMEKDMFRDKLYRYTITGLDQQYTETYSHILSLRTLAPGNYSVLVSCNSKSGAWSVPKAVLHIVVTPPWYQRPYVYILFGVFILLLAAWIGYLSVKRRNRMMRQKMQEHIHKINEEKIHFLINISHELRTPLTLIYAPLKRLLDKNNPDKPETIKGQLSNIYRQVLNMRNTINMVLDINSLKEIQGALHKTPQRLNEWVRTVAKDFESELESRNIRIDYQLDKAIQYVRFDESKCTTVLSNLLMNALKFSSPHTTITLSTCLTEDNTKARVSVSDQGIGLDNLDTDQLFTRYYQGNHNQSGNGIGLSFAKLLIERHGGLIGARKNDDKGAVFFFELPMDLSEECASETDKQQDPWSPIQPLSPATDSFSTHNYSIMIVEDQKELNAFLKESLKDSFREIHTAANGEEAIELIRRKSPDIIVSDIMMPRMNGYELCQRIKEDIITSHIPVVLLTARGDPDSITMGYKLGADAYLAKPFDLDLLLAVIINQLKNRERIKQKYRESYLHPKEIELAQINNPDEEFMLKLNKLIYENISLRELDVRFLTSQMGMSRTPLYTKLKALTNMGVNDYINMVRIDYAAQLLTASTMSITEISESVGFEYPRYFSSLFKQLKGITPSQYRKEKEATK